MKRNHERTNETAHEDASTAAWVEASLCAVMDRCPREERDRTMPIIVLSMAHELGFENLHPKLQSSVERALAAAGIHQEMSSGEAHQRMLAYVERLRPNHDLLREIRAVFERHADAHRDRTERGFARASGRTPTPAPHAASCEKPAGSFELKSFGLPVRA